MATRGPGKGKVTTSIALPEDVKETFEKMAKDQGVTAHKLMVEVLVHAAKRGVNIETHQETRISFGEESQKEQASKTRPRPQKPAPASD